MATAAALVFLVCIAANIAFVASAHPRGLVRAHFRHSL